MMLCPNCHKNEAQYKEGLGYYPCSTCLSRTHTAPKRSVEFTSDSIKQQRKENWKDIHGAHRKGVASKEYRDTYGEQALRDQGFSEREIQHAQNVWSDDTYYKN